MRLLHYWIQRADFSSSDHDAVDVEGAVRAFTTHDWSEELAFMSELVSSGREYCPPGIGFIDPDDLILHVCPTADGRAMVHYHSDEVRKVFGFIPTFRPLMYTKEGVQQSEVVELIHSFFAGRHDCIVRKLGTA